MQLIGGSESNPNTFEVCADSGDTIGDDTYAFGTVNIGTATESAYIRLVNEYLNDGDNTVTDPNVGKSNDGEQLLATTLTIGPGSTLDLNGESVRVSNSSLNIDSTGTLNLNTGLTLAVDDIVYAFVGMGDQTATWITFQDRVLDSGNPTLSFAPVLDGGDTYWQAIPEPSTLAMLFTAGLLWFARRRRA
jgi:hypothetical protein